MVVELQYGRTLSETPFAGKIQPKRIQLQKGGTIVVGPPPYYYPEDECPPKCGTMITKQPSITTGNVCCSPCKPNPNANIPPIMQPIITIDFIPDVDFLHILYPIHTSHD